MGIPPGLRSLRAIVCAAALLAPAPAAGGTYFVAARGSDAGAGTEAAPWKSFAKAWRVLRPGDVLIVGDGEYRNASPPQGKAGKSDGPITVRAAADGRVRITDGLEFRNNAYLVFEGFTISAPAMSLQAASAGKGLVSHHLTFRRMGFQTTTEGEDGGVVLFDGTHHVLFEDFWVWGGGRYSVQMYGGPGGSPPNLTCDFNTFRRGVIRQGPAQSSGGNPEAALAIYYGSNNVIENVIAIDGVADSDSSNAAFYLTSHAPPPSVSSNRFFGVLALNNLGMGWYLDHNGSGSRNEVHNSVFWRAAGAGVALYSGGAGDCDANVIDHVTVGQSKNDGLSNYCNGTIVTASVFVRNGGTGLKQGRSSGSIGRHEGNLSFANPGGPFEGISTGPGDTVKDPALRYIARIEPGTPCAGSTPNSPVCGADLTTRYVNGALTTTPLWPWPNEERIKREMCTQTPTRGFCAAASLTAHIWGLLGNAVPGFKPQP